MANETLLAVPFFTFMGLILERSGMAEDLLDTIGQLFGPIRGGLAYAVIFVGALLAATTGVVAASVISMGLISLPIMLRYGYDKRLATGVIAASGTLAQIIPPSLVLIVMADQLGKSVGDMYAGAFIPGLLLTGLYVGYVILVSIFKPKWVPALPLGGPHACAAPRSLLRVLTTLVPPLTLIFLVLGTIFLGIATPTEGGAMGATGALIMAIVRRRMSLALLKQAMEKTAKLTTFVLFILIGARVFSLTFYGVDGHLWVEHLLTNLPGGPIGFLIVVNLLVFVLAFFLDYFELAFIIVPLLGPVAEKLGIDLIWFGVLLGVNMQTSFLHPPFGFALFFLRSVAPTSVKSSDIYWGAIPFVLIQIIMVAPDHHLPADRHRRTRQAETRSTSTRSRSSCRKPTTMNPLKKRLPNSPAVRPSRPSSGERVNKKRGLRAPVCFDQRRVQLLRLYMNLAYSFSATRNHEFWSLRNCL